MVNTIENALKLIRLNNSLKMRLNKLIKEKIKAPNHSNLKKMAMSLTNQADQKLQEKHQHLATSIEMVNKMIMKTNYPSLILKDWANAALNLTKMNYKIRKVRKKALEIIAPWKLQQNLKNSPLESTNGPTNKFKKQ